MNDVRTIGRAVGADFVLDDPLVSRAHCRIMELPNGELEVQDLNSTNGTFINGTRIQNARLTSGDCLKIGRLELIALKNDD
jgi:pSer/pThr/pTyr-binding forkhead associated (FHA) protein